MNANVKHHPMLLEKLSTNLTSLNVNEDRLAIVIEMVIGADGALQNANIDRARVCNHARLAYHSVADWLEGNDSLPEEVAGVNGLDANQPISIATTERDIAGRKPLERQDV